MHLKPWLKEKKKTLDWLAGELGISVTSAWRLANGEQDPSLSTAEAIIRLTDGEVTFEDLLAACRERAATEAA